MCCSPGFRVLNLPACAQPVRPGWLAQDCGKCALSRLGLGSTRSRARASPSPPSAADFLWLLWRAVWACEFRDDLWTRGRRRPLYRWWRFAVAASRPPRIRKEATAVRKKISCKPSFSSYYGSLQNVFQATNTRYYSRGRQVMGADISKPALQVGVGCPYTNAHSSAAEEGA